MSKKTPDKEVKVKQCSNPGINKTNKPEQKTTQGTHPAKEKQPQAEYKKTPPAVKVGKIGYCTNKVLGILQDNEQRKNDGHYVYISKVNKNGTCNVNIITSLEKKQYDFYNNRLKYVRDKKTYAIPHKDANFSKWSGIEKQTFNISTSNITDVGRHEISSEHIAILKRFLK